MIRVICVAIAVLNVFCGRGATAERINIVLILADDRYLWI
jgi:hypothetical protein